MFFTKKYKEKLEALDIVVFNPHFGLVENAADNDARIQNLEGRVEKLEKQVRDILK